MNRTTIRLPLAIALILIGLVSHATVYYVSHNGDDTNSGTATNQAWRSIARVMQHMYNLQPGDQVLFERGGIYPGKLEINMSGTSGSPLVFGAYGTGERPIISGGVPVTEWVQHQGNIWRAPFAQAPKYVLVNNEPMTLARFPNHGWLRNVAGSASHVSAPELSQSSGYWDGGEIVVRTTNWSYDRSTITTSTNGTVNFEPVHVDLGNNDWGFFLSGKLTELDMAGEWYHDAATGQLYLWAPNNANPNDLSVLASIHDKGLAPGWQRSHIRIENLIVQGQTLRGISTEGSNNVLVTGCLVRHCYIGVSSSGNNNQYLNNEFHHTFGSGLNVYDHNSLIENNVLTDIAIEPGMGESIWGYMGMNVTGQGTVVRNNRLTNIGYIGMDVNGSTLVEKNVVINATSILNDGAGISFDHTDGVIIRDNIVMDMVGDMESVATSHWAYYPICFGIYFGNTSIKNTIVERNTVTRCNGAGIHVDHTMVSTGNQIKDNILFDNNVQLSLSDYSNYNGPGATQPYHVPNYNGIYSGNILYSVRPEQLCMRQFHVYSPNPVDFGTFTNNKYFHPYNEMSIMIKNFQGGGEKRYTLESWQTQFNEDQGSTRSPLRINPYEVTEVLGPNQIPNGHFDYNVNGWGGWPTQAQVTHSSTFLDNGAMKVNFTDNSSYDQFFLYPDAMPQMQAGDFYRLKFSLQSNISGTLTTEMKNQSQLQMPFGFYRKQIPFSNERRDMELFFQATGSEAARLQFFNHYTEGVYWLDNIRLERVSVVPVDPYSRHILVYNDQNTSQTFSLEGCWSLISGTPVSGSITVPAFSSVVLQKETDETCNLTTGLDEFPGIAPMPTFHPNPVKAGNMLHLSQALDQTADVRMIDITGRTVLTSQMRAGTTQFPIDGSVRPGVYILHVAQNGTIKDQRIVVE